jgi:hypothetical protein
MAWSDSHVFRAMMTDQLSGTAVFDLNAPSDTYRVALFNNSVTPDKDVSSANSAFDVGQWDNVNEVSDGVLWTAGGVALSSMTVTAPASGVVMFDAADTVSGSGVTLSEFFGCQIYNDTMTSPVANQGVCYIYFGGGQEVSGGTLTLSWSSLGLIRWLV